MFIFKALDILYNVSTENSYKDKNGKTTFAKGKKATGYIFYEVPKNAETIVLEYEPSIWEDGKVEFKVK